MSKQRYVWDAEKKTWVPSEQRTSQRVHYAGIGGTAGWPIESDALGVHPSQRQEAYEESVRHGVPTQFDSKGCAIIENEQHRRRLGKALGYHDRNCFNW